MSVRLTRIFPVLIIILGCWLRLRYFGDIEFKNDEATALEMMQKFVSGEIVTRGLTASIGVANPPLFIYRMAPVRLVTSSPYLTTLYITLLNIIALIIGWILYRKRFGDKTAITVSHCGIKSPLSKRLPVVVIVLHFRNIRCQMNTSTWQNI